MASSYLIAPDPDDPRLSSTVAGIDQTGATVETRVVTERPLTLYLNAQEIVTMMTIGDHPTCSPSAICATRTCSAPTIASPASTMTRSFASSSCARSAPTELRGEAEEEGAHLGLRAGHGLRRRDGRLRRDRARRGRDAQDQLALRAHQGDQHDAVALSRRRRHPWLRALRGGPAARLHGGCRPPQRGRQDRRLDVAERRLAARQDFLHDRPPHLGDGHQDGDDGDPDPRLPLRLHRLGRGAGAEGGADAHRPRPREALRGARRARSASCSTPTPPGSRRKPRGTPQGRRRIDEAAE